MDPSGYSDLSAHRAPSLHTVLEGEAKRTGPLSYSAHSIGPVPKPLPKSFASKIFEKINLCGALAVEKYGDGVDWFKWNMLKKVKDIALAKQLLNQTHRRTQRELQEMTGDAQLGKLLEDLAPKIEDSLHKNHLKAGVVQKFLYSESQLFQLVLNVMLSKMIVNIGKHIYEKEDAVRILTPIEILARLSEIVLEGVESIQPELAVAESIENDPLERQQAQREAIQPLVDNLLVVIFPKGMDELMLRVGSRILWAKIKNSLLPDTLLALALFLRGPEKDNLLNAIAILKKSPGNEFMSSAATEFAHLATGWGRDMLSDPLIARGIAKKTNKNIFEQEGSPANTERTAWFAKQIEAVVDIHNPSMESFWNFLDKSIEGMIAYLLLNLSRGKTGDEDASVVIFMNVVKEVNDFAKIYDAEINAIKYDLESQGINYLESVRYKNSFVPLALRLQNLAGLVPDDERIPGFLREFVMVAFNQRLPTLLVQHYHTTLLPLAELFNENKKKPELQRLLDYKQGEKLILFFERISHMISDGLRQQCTSKSEQVALLAEGEVSTLLPPAKERMRNLVKLTLQDGAGSSSEVIDVGLAREDKKVQSLKIWVHDWINLKLKAIGNTQDERVAKLWNFIELHTQDLMAHAFLHCARTKDPDANLSVLFFDHLMEVFTSFYVRYSDKIDARYRSLQAAHVSPENDPQFVGYMRVLCEEIFDAFGFSEADSASLPKVIRSQLKWVVTEKAPALLAAQYKECVSPIDAMKAYHAEMEKVLGVDKESAQKIEDLCDVLTNRIMGKIDASIKGEINRVLEGTSVSLDSALFKQFRDNYPSSLIKSFLMQAFTNYAEKIQKNRGSASLSFAQLIAPLNTFFQQQIAQHKMVIGRALSIAHPVQRKAELAKALTPFANGLLELISNPAEQAPLHLPFANLFGDVWDKLRDQVLPEVMAEMFLDSMLWTDQMSQNRIALRQLTQSENVLEACDVLAEFTATLIPPFIVLNRVDIAESIRNSLANTLQAQGVKGQEVEGFLKLHESAFRKAVSEELFSAFRREPLALEPHAAYTKEYLEGAYLKIFHNVFDRIHHKEHPQGNAYEVDFLLNMGVRMLEATKEHLKIINAISAKAQIPAHDMPFEVFLQALSSEGVAINGLSTTPKAIEATAQIKEANAIIQKTLIGLPKLTDQKLIIEAKASIKRARKVIQTARQMLFQERSEFFQAQSKPLLELLNLHSAQDLPFPSPMKESIWDSLQSEFMPQMLSSFYDVALSPDFRNLMLQTALEILNAPSETLIGPEYVYTDAKQKHLDKVCGEVLLEFVKLIPDAMLTPAFRRFQQVSAEILGQIVRRQLSQDWTLTKMFDHALKVTKSAIAKKVPPSELEEKVDAQQVLKAQQQVKDSEDIRSKMVATVKRMASKNIDEQLKGILSWLRKKTTTAIHSVFGKYGSKVVAFFEYLADTALFRASQTLFAFCFKPLSLVFWFFADIYIKRKAERVMKVLAMDVHENLLQRMLDELLLSVTQAKA